MYRHGLAEPYSSFAQIARIPAARAAPLDHIDLVEAFRRWRAAQANKLREKPVLNIADLAPASEPALYDKAQGSPRTLKLKSPRGDSAAGKLSPRLSPKREHSRAGAPRAAARSKSPVPRLALDKLAAQPVLSQAPGDAATSPKRSPKKLLKSPRQEPAKPAAAASALTKETPRQGFFPDNVFSAWMGGESARSASSKSTGSDATGKAAVSGSQAPGWLSGLGFATPKSAGQQAAGGGIAAAARRPGPAPVPAPAPAPASSTALSSSAAAPVPKMKNELVPSPRRVQLTPAQIEKAEAEIKQAVTQAAAAALAGADVEDRPVRQPPIYMCTV